MEEFNVHGGDDADVETLLASWQMPNEIIEAFRSNNITIDYLGQLNQDHLKELCPQIGNRIKLTNKINEYLDSKASTVTASASTIDGETASVDLLTEGNGDLTISLNDLFPGMVTNNQSFSDFDLKTLLETSPCGKSIINYYNTHGKLDSKRKNRLTDIVIRHLFTFIINKRLTYDDYNIITGKIITLFPKETAGTYFTAPIKKQHSAIGKSIAARGKLVDKVRNFIFQSQESKSKRSAETENEPGKKQKRNHILLSIHEEDVEWLNNNNEPWQEVKEKWNKTVQLRHELEYTDVHDFVTKWKVLQLPAAPELISDDFKYLYPDQANRFKDCWKLFIQKVFELKKEEINSDDNKRNLLSSLPTYDTDDAKFPTELALLVNIVPPKGRISKVGKFSTQECLDSIMMIVENPGDLNVTVQSQIEKAAKRKIQVQPYVILLGSLQKVVQAYIVIDNIKYTFESVTEAFETLFKSFHVLNARYPKPSEHIHLIIQRCVYNICTRFDNPVPYISDILALKI